jgi:hypothetical protein
MAFLTISSAYWRTGKPGSNVRLDDQRIGVRVSVGGISHFAVSRPASRPHPASRSEVLGANRPLLTAFSWLWLVPPVYCDNLIISHVFLNTSVTHGEVEQYVHWAVTASFPVHLTNNPHSSILEHNQMKGDVKLTWHTFRPWSIDSIFLRNVVKCIPYYTAQHPKRQHPSQFPPCEPQNSQSTSENKLITPWLVVRKRTIPT